MLNRDEYRQMLLAGSVTFPATFPQVGRLALVSEPRPGRSAEQVELLSVDEAPSPRVTLSRRVLLSSVRAVFLPRDPNAVQFADGEWLLEEEIGCCLQQRLQKSDGPLYGIIFVPENAPSMLQVSAGMTAAESTQYYPPLPGDPSHNHYNPWPMQGAVASIQQRACSLAEDATIYMQARSSLDPWWGLQRVKATPVRDIEPQETIAALDTQSLVTSCTISHVGLPVGAGLESHCSTPACSAAYPFPTDDLQP